MNKMLVAIFDNETAAEAGVQALNRLHSRGDITLYASGVMVKDMNGKIALRKSIDQGPIGTVTGLAVGSLIGMLGGPVGMAVGAVTGTMAGAVRDFWMAGVGIDFIEQAESFLHPGKVALVAEMEEEWIIPVDSAIESIGGRIFRRTRMEVAEAQFDHDVAALKSEIKELEAEAKAPLLKAQLNQASDEVKAKIDERVKRVKSAYHVRGAKLSQAWHLAKEALAI
jgi:uncharacterized membrane protein